MKIDITTDELMSLVLMLKATKFPDAAIDVMDGIQPKKCDCKKDEAEPDSPEDVEDVMDHIVASIVAGNALRAWKEACKKDE